jgi:phosphate starvation-inducible PhoH-like protein
MLHFTRYNNIDSNVIERVILGENQDDIKTLINDKILVHGVGGKIIKAMTPNQQLLVDTIKKTIWFCCRSGRNGKPIQSRNGRKGVERKQVKRIILTRPAVEAGKT